MLCRALRRAGVRAYVVSLGRGRAGASLHTFRSSVRRVGGVPVLYGAYSGLRVLSELLSLLVLPFLAARSRGCGPASILFYNREYFYIPALLAAVPLGYRRFLDLEDGEVLGGDSRWRLSPRRLASSIYDKLCSGGALLACSALAKHTAVRRTLCYYGAVERVPMCDRWGSRFISVLLGGTLSADTGVDLLVAAVKILRLERPEWASSLQFEVTGKGPRVDALRRLSMDQDSPRILVHGRTSDEEYMAIVGRCEVGLALKPCTGALAHTTFPSKVVEMASIGMLVVSTDISDVRKILGMGALYIERDDPRELIRLLRIAVESRSRAQEIANEGYRNVWLRCDSLTVGESLRDFLLGGAA